MKHLAAMLLSKIWRLFQQVLKKIIFHHSKIGRTDIAENEEFSEDLNAQSKKQIPLLGRGKRFIQTLISKYRQHLKKSQRFRRASLFTNGKTNSAALSRVLRGVAEVLSQKMNLSWKTGATSTLSYEKEDEDGKGKICYYVTDNPETPHPETIGEEAALAVIDQFDPRACAIHLIYCALVTSMEKPWEGSFAINDKQLLEYTGLIKRRDLCRHEKLNILYHLVRQPAQVLAHVAWSKQGKVGAFTVADLKIWDITVLRDFDTDEAGNSKLVGLKVIGQPGAWAKYFLNKLEYYHHTGIITKKTVQKLFSIGKQNAGAARILVWLTFQIKPKFQDYFIGKTLMEIAYGTDRVALAQANRQLRRQLADDFETDLKVAKEAGWYIEIETGPAWLEDNNRTKRPIGFWNELLNSRWRFYVPTEVEEYLTLPERQRKENDIQPLPSNVIREARKAKGWSRAFFAVRMGKSISWVDAVETGHRQVSQKDLPKLLKELEPNLHN